MPISCFEIQFDTTTVVTDPCVTYPCSVFPQGPQLSCENIDGCDIITLSHFHWDHVTDIPALMKKYSPIILSGLRTTEVLAEWLDCSPSPLYPMESNLELDFGEVKIKSLWGRHIDLCNTYHALEERFHNSIHVKNNPTTEKYHLLGSTEFRNYLFINREGKKLLIWGGKPSLVQQNMLQDLQPDIAIMQCGDPVATANLAAVIGCKILIPHHLDMFKTQQEYMPKVRQLRQAFEQLIPDGQVFCLEHGKWNHF